MRSLSNWERSDLQELIDSSVQESLTLDYKESRALANDDKCRNELSKDVSAFANSAGGRLVYGIVENKHRAERVDDGVDPAAISREWLEQVINSQIRPRVQGIVIRQIVLDTGRVAYAIDIPQASAFAPHQANDKKYYRRFNFQSVAMEDHEIRDVMRRSAVPELFVDLKIARTQARSSDYEVAVNVAIGNHSPEPAHFAMLRILVDEKLKARTYASQWQVYGDLVGLRPITVLKRRIAPPHDVPIYQEERFFMGDVVMMVPRMDSGRYFFGYRINCPGFSTEKIGLLRNEDEDFSLERWAPKSLQRIPFPLARSG